MSEPQQLGVQNRDLFIKHISAQRDSALNALAASGVQLELALAEIERLRSLIASAQAPT